jgi:hypothetical protein
VPASKDQQWGADEVGWAKASQIQCALHFR